MTNELDMSKKVRGGGPKTLEGKARSAQNALKHGRRSARVAELLRESKALLKEFKDSLPDKF